MHSYIFTRKKKKIENVRPQHRDIILRHVTMICGLALCLCTHSVTFIGKSIESIAFDTFELKKLAHWHSVRGFRFFFSPSLFKLILRLFSFFTLNKFNFNYKIHSIHVMLNVGYGQKEINMLCVFHVSFSDNRYF